ncbi:uncharacterized protein [Diadema antillarum]|uniref:uncharacterized protein n=1 Tax=Diadema antillarum TaxID=105358 RepID=UPI003A8511D7
MYNCRYMEDLIREVEKYPSLYDKQSPSYNDTNARSRIWKKISRTLDMKETKARQRWINLRGDYTKHVRRQKEFRNGPNLDGAKKFRYAEQMEFLRPHLRKTTAKMASEADGSFQEHDYLAQGDSGKEEILGEEQPDILPRESEEAGTSSSGPQSRPLPRKRLMKKRKLELQDAMLDFFRSRRELSEVSPFFVHISQTVERLPRLVQLQLRSQIYNLVSQAEIENQTEIENLAESDGYF